MEKIRLGRTGPDGHQDGVRARCPSSASPGRMRLKLVRRAYEAGINYFDTANMYTDSEEKLGEALHDVRPGTW